MKKAVAYLRFSTKGQMNFEKYEDTSQFSRISEYAIKEGYTILDTIIDTCSGIQKGERKLDAYINEHNNNLNGVTVIVSAYDRVARDKKVLHYYLELLEKYHMELISTNDISLKETDLDLCSAINRYCATNNCTVDEFIDEFSKGMAQTSDEIYRKENLC